MQRIAVLPAVSTRKFASFSPFSSTGTDSIPTFGKNCLYFSTFPLNNQLFFSFSLRKRKQSLLFTTGSAKSFFVLLRFTIVLNFVLFFPYFPLFSKLFASQCSRQWRTPVSHRYSYFLFIFPFFSHFLSLRDCSNSFVLLAKTFLQHKPLFLAFPLFFCLPPGFTHC